MRAEYKAALQEYQMRRSEALNALQPLREHAATIASIASAAYAEGGTELLRLLDAERARLDAELAWTQGMVDYRQSIVQPGGRGGGKSMSTRTLVFYLAFAGGLLAFLRQLP